MIVVVGTMVETGRAKQMFMYVWTRNKKTTKKQKKKEASKSLRE